MRVRPSSRLLVIDASDRVLLFRFVHSGGALAGQDFWATPGGGVEDNETFEQAAIRELEEETGIRVDDVGGEVACRQVVLQLPDGEHVIADERYFVVKVEGDAVVSRGGWTELETTVVAAWRWWSEGELAQASAIIWPENLVAMLNTATRR